MNTIGGQIIWDNLSEKAKDRLCYRFGISTEWLKSIVLGENTASPVVMRAVRREAFKERDIWFKLSFVIICLFATIFIVAVSLAAIIYIFYGKL